MATEADPLAQRAAAGWKGWAGGALVNLSGSFRHVVIESNSTLSTQLPAVAPAPGQGPEVELMANTLGPDTMSGPTPVLAASVAAPDGPGREGR